MRKVSSVKHKENNHNKPLDTMIIIQDCQFRLDKLKRDVSIMNKEIRSLSQSIPKIIRELPLR